MKTVYGIIYKATSPDGKVYIGQTIQALYMRKAAHKFRAKLNDKRTAFQIALLDEGFSNFQWEQIDTADSQEELDAKERRWIDRYDSMNPDNGYNNQNGGIKFKASAETKRKISEAQKGEKNTRAKLTETQVRQIKIALANGEKGVSLARRYGVYATLISAIKLGQAWSWVQGNPLDNKAD